MGKSLAGSDIFVWIERKNKKKIWKIKKEEEKY
jgi:hypothetical protein